MPFLLIAAGVLATGVAIYLLILILCAAGTTLCRWLDRRTARRKADAATRVIRRLDLTEQIPVIGEGVDHDAPGGAGRTPTRSAPLGFHPLPRCRPAPRPTAQSAATSRLPLGPRP